MNHLHRVVPHDPSFEDEIAELVSNIIARGDPERIERKAAQIESMAHLLESAPTSSDEHTSRLTTHHILMHYETARRLRAHLSQNRSAILNLSAKEL